MLYSTTIQRKCSNAAFVRAGWGAIVLDFKHFQAPFGVPLTPFQRNAPRTKGDCDGCPVGVVSRRLEFSRFSPAACIEDAATQGTQHPFIQALHEPGCAWRRQMAVLGLGVVLADFAHRWIKVVLLALLGLTAMDQRALAFTAASDALSQAPLGTCVVQRVVSAGSGNAVATLVSGGVRIGDPSGFYWSNSTIKGGNVITKQMIATCLGTPLSNVAGLQQNGADGTYATDTYLGFAFRLTTAANGMPAGWTEFKVGTGSQIPADITPPTLISAVVATTALRIGTTSLVTFTFSEPVTGFSNSNLTVPNGTLSTVTSADSGKTWTATLTPTGSVTAATNGIAVAMSGVSDSSENAATGSVNSNNYELLPDLWTDFRRV